MSGNLEDPAVDTGLEESIFIPVPKKSSTKECSNHQTVALISHADVQAGFRKGRGIRGQSANIHWIIEKAREFQIIMYFSFIDNTKAFDCGPQQTVENSQRDGNTRPPYLPPAKPVCSPKSNIRTGRGTSD